MDTFTIALPQEQASRLRELAERAKVSPEQWLRAEVEASLSRQNPSFAEAAAYVLDKNRELYRRLA